MFPTNSGVQSELLCSAFCSFWSNTWSVNVGNSQVVTVSQSYELNAFRCFEVGQVNDRTDYGASQVDFDEFRQVFWQARNFDFSNNVRNFAAFLQGSFFVDEVHWNVSGQFLASYNAYE